MLIARPPQMRRSEVTDRKVYLNRRQFLLGAVVSAGAAVISTPSADAAGRPAVHGPKLSGIRKSASSTSELPTRWDQITSYNNFYEFAGSDNKDLPSELAPGNLVTSPWIVTVDGACRKPGTYAFEDVVKPETLEERIYRHRCVEGWSMVIPWVGFPLSSFIRRCEPSEKASFVAFFSHYDVIRMPMSRRLPFDWPYREGLRMDEAMHPLAILAVGLYDEVLPAQDGAPIRLVVPWKYGFKSIKSIVRITFTEEQPVGTYQHVDPRSYGFYSNVNPTVDHPRWSQAAERRIGELLKRRTLMFNGYVDDVAGLYAGMDLRKDF